jgi:3-dehydro-L-gulonate 2-dehydrogenase
MNQSVDTSADELRISFEQMRDEFGRILVNHGFAPEKARLCAHIFASNTLDGISSHGIERFPRFIQYIKQRYVLVDEEPKKVHRAGSIEQWDGCLGPGPLNALIATDRAMSLAKDSGMGCVALANTNHWMRGGYYGWKAASAGFMFIGWTNTTANMPAWGAVDPRMGNNPLVLGVPYGHEAVVLDMAMSQFSYGAIESHHRRGKTLPVPGGYDTHGDLTTDPSKILASKRLLPAGYWKGSGLALLMDVMAVLLSGGLSTSKISRREAEYAVSQVFVAIDLSQLKNAPGIAESVEEIIRDFHSSIAVSGGNELLYPGERVLRVRKANLEKGIPVERLIWERVIAL